MLEWHSYFLSPNEIPKQEVILATVSVFQNDADGDGTVMQDFTSFVDKPVQAGVHHERQRPNYCLSPSLGNNSQKTKIQKWCRKEMALKVTNRKGCWYCTKIEFENLYFLNFAWML